jgi:HK97 family phage prohead protease
VLTKDLAPQPLTKADGESGVLTGYASKFWEVDSYGEVTAPGAFARSITDRGPNSSTPRIHLRYEHMYTVGRHTEMAEDDTGLVIDAHVSDDGMYGSAVRRHLADGVPYGLSIGFRRMAERPATDADPLDFTHAPDYVKQIAMQDVGQIRVLTEVKLLENSVVTFPAVDSALITDYRSLDLNQRAIDKLMADLKAGRLSDDHITHLRRLAALVPAADAPADGETPSDSATQTASQARRRYDLEAAYALASAGVPLH